MLPKYLLKACLHGRLRVSPRCIPWERTGTSASEKFDATQYMYIEVTLLPGIYFMHELHTYNIPPTKICMGMFCTLPSWRVTTHSEGYLNLLKSNHFILIKVNKHPKWRVLWLLRIQCIYVCLCSWLSRPGLGTGLWHTLAWNYWMPVFKIFIWIGIPWDIRSKI